MEVTPPGPSAPFDATDPVNPGKAGGTADHRDPADLGRGVLTRRLPVLLQAPTDTPEAEPFEVPAGMSADRFLVKVLFSATRFTVPAMIGALMWSSGEVAVPLIMGAAIDTALATGDATRLLLWICVLAGVYLALSLGIRCAHQMTEYATQHVQHRLRISLSRHVLHPVTPRADHLGGGIVSTMTNDVMRLSALGLTVFPAAEMGAVLFIAVSLLLIYWPLGLIVLIGSPVAIWLMGKLSSNFATSSRHYQDLLATTVGKATDLVAGYRVIKGIRAEDEATRRYREASQTTLRGAYRNLGFLGRYLAGSSAVSSLFVVAITMLAGYYAIEGHMSVGDLIAAVGLTQVLLPQMGMLVNNAIPSLAAARASARRVAEHIREPGTPDAAATAKDAASSHTSLPDVPHLDIVIPGASFRVNPGEMVGVAAGDRVATDFVAALLRPDPARTGATGIAVTVDARPAEDIDYADYRSRVLVSPHNVALFSGTVADNLAGTAPSALRERAIHAAACEDFAADTHTTGEMGAQLSGGQRQRLALARALSFNAPVLVLHDPTTAVDSVTEQAIATRIAGVRAGRSTLLVASSPALLAACDRVIDVREGAVP